MLGRVARAALRITLAVIAILAAVVIVWLATGGLEKLRRAASGPIATATILKVSAEHVIAEGFVGCPTVQQVLDLTPEPQRRELRGETNGIDPWGTPYQIDCASDRVRVFSAGPDKTFGTADDLRALR